MKFVFEQWLPEPREVVFAFFRNPRCLPLLHTEEKHVRVMRHGGDVKIGNETWAEVTLFGILPVALGFRHHLFDPPRKFGERLAHGVFASFTHVHEFAERDGGTTVADHIEVTLPWHFGGEIGLNWLVAPGLKASFAIRHRALDRLATGGELRRMAQENMELLEIL